MNDTKSIFASKGVVGGVIALIGVALGFFGFTVTEVDTVGIAAAIDELVVIGGTLLAIYGRITATKKIA